MAFYFSLLRICDAIVSLHNSIITVKSYRICRVTLHDFITYTERFLNVKEISEIDNYDLREIAFFHAINASNILSVDAFSRGRFV